MNKINPNWITASRLLFFAPLALIMLGINTQESLCICLVLMLGAELTDLIDGKLARATNQVSDLGKILDPLSDSVFHMFVWMGLMKLGWVPLGFVAVFFFRDSVIQTVRTYLAKHKIILAALWPGKYKAVFQAVTQILIVFLHIVFSVLPNALEWILPLPALIVTIYSLYAYLMEANRRMATA